MRTLWERGLPAIQAPRFIRYTALSFIAGKPRSYSFLQRAHKKPGTWPGSLFLRLSYFTAACNACCALRLFLMP
jgi:succinate dehydrogenase/fumarate reductase cytochrome b subunit